MWRWCNRCSCLGPRRGPDPPVGEGPQGVSLPGGTADGEHGTQTSAIRDVGIPTHWGGTGNGGTGVDWGIYHLPPEHGCAIHFDPPYHGLVFNGRAEAGNSPIQSMLGASCPGYHGYQGGAGICRWGGGYRGVRIGVGGRAG